MKARLRLFDNPYIGRWSKIFQSFKNVLRFVLWPRILSTFFFFKFIYLPLGLSYHEIKRRLLLGRKFMTNLDSISKSRDTTLPTKVCLVKAD